jgi:hypothetical protein
MPRYVVERTFADGLQIPADEQGAKACMAVVEVNAGEGVTWVHSYVTDDRSKTFCVYDGPTPRRSAAPPSATACPSTGSPRFGSSTRSSTVEPRRDDTSLTTAKADGYQLITPMIPDMGYHDLNPTIHGFEVAKPHILVYQRRHRALTLGALEPGPGSASGIRTW